VAHTATGVYTLTLTSVPVNLNNVLVNVTIAGSIGGQVSWLFGLLSTLVIHTFDAAGNPADKVFTITVFDTTP
jgi:hypothetical protein